MARLVLHRSLCLMARQCCSIRVTCCKLESRGSIFGNYVIAYKLDVIKTTVARAVLSPVRTWNDSVDIWVRERLSNCLKRLSWQRVVVESNTTINPNESMQIATVPAKRIEVSQSIMCICYLVLHRTRNSAFYARINAGPVLSHPVLSALYFTANSFPSHFCLLLSLSVLFIPVLFFLYPFFLFVFLFRVSLYCSCVFFSFPSCPVLCCLVQYSPSLPKSLYMNWRTDEWRRWGYHGYGCIIDWGLRRCSALTRTAHRSLSNSTSLSSRSHHRSVPVRSGCGLRADAMHGGRRETSEASVCVAPILMTSTGNPAPATSVAMVTDLCAKHPQIHFRGSCCFFFKADGFLGKWFCLI